MSHARQQIRAAAMTLLNATPAAYERVYATRVPPLQQVWPHVLVWCDGDSLADASIHPSPLVVRDLALTVVGRAQMKLYGTETLEDKLDAIAAEVETKLTTTALQASLAKVMAAALTDTASEIVLDEDGQPSYGAVTLNYRIRYAIVEGSPETLA